LHRRLRLLAVTIRNHRQEHDITFVTLKGRAVATDNTVMDHRRLANAIHQALLNEGSLFGTNQRNHAD
jgi:hypothetical protein